MNGSACRARVVAFALIRIAPEPLVQPGFRSETTDEHE